MRVQWAIVAALFVLASAASRGQGGSPFADDPLAKALRTSNVAVARTLQDRISKPALAQIAERAPADRPLKIGFVTSLPPSGKVFGTGAAYTKALHDSLGLGKGVLILVVQRTGHIYAATDSLASGPIGEALRAEAPALSEDPVGAVERVAQRIYERAGAPLPVGNPAPSGMGEAPPNLGESLPPSPGSDSSQVLPVLLVLGAVVALVVLANWSAKRRAAMAEARKPIERLRAETVTDLAYADAYLDLLPDTPDAQAARDARARSAELLDQARRLIRAARTPEDLGRAEAVLQQARDEAGICRQHLDRATGGTGYAVAVEGTEFRATPAIGGARAAPLARDLNIDAIPETERAACFFCSRPSNIADLTPVTIAMNGQRRKVLACQDDVNSIRSGAPPQVRTVVVDGQPRPWFAAPGYDPYRDYWAGAPVYAASYWGPEDALWTGFILGSALSSPIAYPVYVDDGGMPTADPSAAFGAAPDPSGIGGVGEAGFLDASGASDFGNADSDFGAPGTADSFSDAGAADFGSAADFGGGDFSGGSDVGGGDFGGGGDSF